MQNIKQPVKEVVVIETVRTPFGKREGALKGVRPDDLAALVLSKLVAKANIAPNLVDDVIVGCVTQIEEQGWNIGRLAALQAGFPVEVPATTINRMCGSGQQSVHFASQSILAGDSNIMVAAGVESMSRVKMGSDGKDLNPKLLQKFDLVWQGASAELIANKWNLSRQELDEYALASHHKALKAIKAGYFEKETTPVPITDDHGNNLLFITDECPREDTSMEKLASLKPAFKENGLITAGNSSQISDGACAVLLMSEEKAQKLGLKGKAKIKARVVVGSDPITMLDGVIPATRKALAQASLSVDNIDVFEINEAFASVVLAWSKELNINMEKVNPNGGAIALGHPLGASGCRLLATLVNELERRNARYGLQTMCIGHGMATATIVELLNEKGG